MRGAFSQYKKMYLISEDAYNSSTKTEECSNDNQVNHIKLGDVIVQKNSNHAHVEKCATGSDENAQPEKGEIPPSNADPQPKKKKQQKNKLEKSSLPIAPATAENSKYFKNENRTTDTENVIQSALDTQEKSKEKDAKKAEKNFNFYKELLEKSLNQKVRPSSQKRIRDNQWLNQMKRAKEAYETDLNESQKQNKDILTKLEEMKNLIEKSSRELKEVESEKNKKTSEKNQLQRNAIEKLTENRLNNLTNGAPNDSNELSVSTGKTGEDGDAVTLNADSSRKKQANTSLRKIKNKMIKKQKKRMFKVKRIRQKKASNMKNQLASVLEQRSSAAEGDSEPVEDITPAQVEEENTIEDTDPDILQSTGKRDTRASRRRGNDTDLNLLVHQRYDELSGRRAKRSSFGKVSKQRKSRAPSNNNPYARSRQPRWAMYGPISSRTRSKDDDDEATK